MIKIAIDHLFVVGGDPLYHCTFAAFTLTLDDSVVSMLQPAASILADRDLGCCACHSNRPL